VLLAVEHAWRVITSAKCIPWYWCRLRSSCAWSNWPPSCYRL